MLVFGSIVAACGGSAKQTAAQRGPWWKGVAVNDLRGKAEGGSYPEVKVQIADNTMTPQIIRIDPGVHVAWKNLGRSVHNILKADSAQDFGKQFGFDQLEAGGEYEFEFKTAGVYPYYCSLHGNADQGMVAMIVVGDVDISTGKSNQSGPTVDGVLKVPQQFKTIQAAVDATKPGAMVLVDKGVYNESVQVNAGHENIVIRGVDRNAVILDGEFDKTKPNGFLVQANGVAIENMTARNYTTNAFFWRGVKGYRGSYLSSYRTGDYGLYAFDSEIGQFDHDYAVGSRDAGFYIGQCAKCRAVITDSVSEWNGLGYSGTNAGGELYIVNSIWRYNRAGIVPNSETGEKLFPQRQATIVGNQVYSNNNVKTPAIDIAQTALGNGILIAGGHENVVERNRVWDHDIYGIGLIPLPETFLFPTNKKAQDFAAENNSVRDNAVEGSRIADLSVIVALNRTNEAGGNCFSGNQVTTTSPLALETSAGCGKAVAANFEANLAQFVRLFTATKPKEVDYQTSKLPPLPVQPNMADPLNAPAKPANNGVPMRIDIAAIKLPVKI